MVVVNVYFADELWETRMIPMATDPVDFFSELIADGLDWKVDYSQCSSEEEKQHWAEYDMAVRFYRAIEIRRLPVIIGNQRFRDIDKARQAFLKTGRFAAGVYDSSEDGVEVILGEYLQ